MVLQEESKLKSLKATREKLAEQQNQLHAELRELNQQEQHVDTLLPEAGGIAVEIAPVRAAVVAQVALAWQEGHASAPGRVGQAGADEIHEVHAQGLGV